MGKHLCTNYCTVSLLYSEVVGSTTIIQVFDWLHSCELTDCAALFCSQYRFLSQWCCEQAGKICPIVRLQVNVNITSAAHCICVCVLFIAYTGYSNLHVSTPSLPPADYIPQWGEQYVCSAEGWVPGVCVWDGHQESVYHNYFWLFDQLHHENRPLSDR